MSQTCWRETPEGLVLQIRVAPRSSRTALIGAEGGELRIALNAPPADGKANRALIDLLSKTFKTAKSDIEIIRGETSRKKSVLIRGLEKGAIVKALGN